MATIAEAFQIAIQHHLAGQLPSAEQIYRQILQVEPRHAQAWHMLGVIATQCGQHQTAYDLIHRAIEMDAGQADMYCNLGSVAEKLGAADEAIQLYRQALRLSPLYAEAHNNLGLALRNRRRFEEATRSLIRAIEINPNYADALNNYGIVLTDQGQLDDAVAALGKALAIRPNYAEAHNNLGIALMKQGKYPEAIAAYRQSLEFSPDFKLAYNNLANVLLEQGSLNEAIQAYQMALKIDPTYAEAYGNLGNAFQECGQMDAAIDAFQRSLQLAPDQAETHYNLGRVLQSLGRHEEAAGALERALQLRSNYGEAAGMLLYQYVSNCDWQRQEDFSQRLLAMRAAGNPIELVSPLTFTGLSGLVTPEEQLQGAQRWVAKTCNISENRRFHHSRLPDRTLRSKLRIGYLSADFHGHATAWLMTELIELHDRRRFEVVAYSYGVDDKSAMRQRIVKAFDRFVEIGSDSFASSAQRIYDDQIDILVDLKGFTESGRPKILALRPAPIQVNYLGYPGTMGADFIDYMIVDDFVAPLEQQAFYSERLVHLPGCYQVNDSRPTIPIQTPSRLECGLPETAFVFCSFNSNYKITRSMFDVWMRLMKAVPQSVLWLIAANPQATENLYRAAESRGVARTRIVFAPHRNLLEHLPRYRLADLFLDSFPVNAHTTASDALRMGLPLVTLVGQTFASRVAGSLLRAVGLEELITYRLEDYEGLAWKLATRPEELARVRQQLQANLSHSKLYDGQSFARNLERVYERMWDIYARGEPARNLSMVDDS